MKRTALGAHIYAGAFTVGVSEVFDVQAILEDTGYGASTHRLNFPDIPVYVGKPWPSLRYEGVSFLYANPPCAIFSPLGSRIGRGAEQWRTDPRVGCWRDVLALVPQVKPRAWALESVPQAYAAGREMVDEFTVGLLLLGYSVTHLFVDSRWMGIPQSRKRFFLVAHRPSTFRISPLNWAPPPTVNETFALIPADIGLLQVKDPELVAAMRPGEQGVDVFDRLHPDPELNPDGSVKGRPRLGDQRLPLDGVMGAFTGAAVYHPTQDRHCSYPEMLALGGYPDWFRCDGNPRDWPSLLARGVMPPVARWLARSIDETLDYPDGKWEDRTVRRVDLREPEIASVDLTRAYLDDRGKARVRARADGTFQPVVRDGTARVKIRSTKRRDPTNPFAPTETNVPEYSGAEGKRTSRTGNVYSPEKVPEPPVVSLDEAPPAQPGESSADYVRRHLRDGFSDPDLLAGCVRTCYPGRLTTRKEIYLHYCKLEEEGCVTLAPPWFKRRAKRK